MCKEVYLTRPILSTPGPQPERQQLEDSPWRGICLSKQLENLNLVEKPDLGAGQGRFCWADSNDVAFAGSQQHSAPDGGPTERQPEPRRPLLQQ